MRQLDLIPCDIVAHKVVSANELEAGDHFMQVCHGLRGWFACDMWINGEDYPGEEFAEPWQSDPMSFATREEALVRARELARALDVPLIE